MDQMERDYPTTAGALDRQDWGAKMIPAGAHQGTTFKDLYGNKKMCNQYRNRSSPSQWILSLRAFIKSSESDDLKKNAESEAKWEVLKEDEKGAMDPPAEQPKDCQFNLKIPAGYHVNVSIVMTPNTSAGQK